MFDLFEEQKYYVVCYQNEKEPDIYEDLEEAESHKKSYSIIREFNTRVKAVKFRYEYWLGTYGYNNVSLYQKFEGTDQIIRIENGTNDNSLDSDVLREFLTLEDQPKKLAKKKERKVVINIDFTDIGDVI